MATKPRDADSMSARMKRRDRLQSEARHVADMAARANPSDPFVYGRVFCHMLNGVGQEHVYNAARGANES